MEIGHNLGAFATGNRVAVRLIGICVSSKTFCNICYNARRGAFEL